MDSSPHKHTHTHTEIVRLSRQSNSQSLKIPNVQPIVYWQSWTFYIFAVGRAANCVHTGYTFNCSHKASDVQKKEANILATWAPAAA